MSSDNAARTSMMKAICEWGQPEAERVAAVQGALDAAGFNAKATCWPIFGGIWKSPCEGPDGEAATTWLRELTDNLKRGEYNSEVRQVREAIERASA